MAIIKVFLDTEFIERPCTIELIGLALVAEDGREYYAQHHGFHEDEASPWVREHVIPRLTPCPIGHDRAWHRRRWGQPCHPNCPWMRLPEIRAGVLDFIAEVLGFVGADVPEFWSYFASYDWVVFCWLFGSMMDLPAGWPPRIYDLRQWLDHRGLAHVKQPADMPHHSLSDARWVAETYRRYAHG